MRRYDKTLPINFGKQYSTSYTIPFIRENIKNGNIRYTTLVLQERERLDAIAGQVYGDSTLSWIIAAASNIGFSIGCPAGTLLKIPNLDDLDKFL